MDRELEEGLTWEAKGPADIRPAQIRKAVSGFANAIGGSLIIGAERDATGAWQLPGAEFRGGEAKTWLSSVISDLSPAPRYDVCVFPVGERLVAIVAVEPIDVPPSISDGSVYVRVSGQTVPVTDPTIQQTQPIHGGMWVARIYFRGTAAVAFLSERVDSAPRPSEIVTELAPAWRLAAGALKAAGAAGDAFLALHHQTTHIPDTGDWTMGSTPTMDVARAVMLEQPEEHELDSTRRELEREAGYPSFEPEPEVS